MTGPYYGTHDETVWRLGVVIDIVLAQGHVKYSTFSLIGEVTAIYVTNVS